MEPSPTSERLIDRWLGARARRLHAHRIAVAAPPDVTYDALQRVRIDAMPFVRALFALRRIRYRPGMTLREFFSSPPFLLLDEAPRQEAVTGVAARGLRPVALPDAASFRAQARGVKSVAAFRVEPAGDGSAVTTETWVETFGRRAGLGFRAYWLLVGPFSALIRRQVLGAAKRAAEDAARSHPLR